MLIVGILRIKIFYVLAAYFLLCTTKKTICQNAIYLEIQNDFLNYRGHGTDRYFTGGVSSGYLVHLSKELDHYIMVSFNQKMYTPSNISLYPEELKPTDYPYAGLTYLSFGYLNFNKRKTAYTKGVFSWGATGPSSGARLIQQELHKLIDDRLPNGWSTQINLGNFMQIQIEHTRSILNQRLLKINSSTNIELGSIFNNISAALEIKMDHTKDPFITFFNKRLITHSKFDICIWTKPKLTYVMNNRLLAINPNPFGINARSINKFLYQSSVGIGIQLKKFSISLIQHQNSPEFKSASPHAFGEIAILLNI